MHPYIYLHVHIGIFYVHPCRDSFSRTMCVVVNVFLLHEKCRQAHCERNLDKHILLFPPFCPRAS